MYPSLMSDMFAVPQQEGLSAAQHAIDLADRFGFRGVDLRLNTPGVVQETGDPQPLVDAMHTRGLRPGYCSLLTGNLGVDDATWQQSLIDLPQRAALAQALGYTRTSTVVLPFHKSLGFEYAFLEHVTRIRQALPVLQQHGLTLGLEYVSPVTRRAPHPYAFIHNMRGMLALTKACGGISAGIGLMLDSFHWHCAGESEAHIHALTKEQVVVVHLNDAPTDTPTEELRVTHRELPGESGVIDTQGFLGALADIDYDGPVTIEATHPKWSTINTNDALAAASASLNHCLQHQNQDAAAAW